MRTRQVNEIIQPYEDGIPLYPSVHSEEKLAYAVELMLSNNIKTITVVMNRRPIGVIHLRDALEKLGIEIPTERME